MSAPPSPSGLSEDENAVHESDERLHALWSPGAGLLLWGFDTAVFTADIAAPLAIKPDDRRLRRRATVALPAYESDRDAAPATREHTVPAVALGPAAAVRFLRGLDRSNAGAAGELQFLAHVYRGLQRWVEAGRVVPELFETDGEWRARWILLGEERQRAWLAELAAALPAVLRGPRSLPARAVLDDLVRELTDPTVRSVLPERVTATARPDHPLLTALLHDEPFTAGEPSAVAAALTGWRESVTTGDPDVVLKLVEPDDDADLDVAGDAGAGAAAAARRLLAGWRLQVCLRADGAPPTPVARHRLDPHLLDVAVRGLTSAFTAYPRLQDLPSDPHSMDLFLPPEVVVDLVAHGAAALRQEGITLLLPRSWTVLRPTLRLRAGTPTSGATSGVAGAGLNQIVDYDWELALGGKPVTTAEMDRLTRAQSDLVRFRGEWVQLDRDAVTRAVRYLTGVPAAERRTLGSLFDLLGQEPPVPVETACDGWLAGLLEGVAAPSPVPQPPDLRATLRPYQIRGLSWLVQMDERGLGAILADDMGLGKTIQVLALLLHERGRSRPEPKPTLLVCPMSVVGNWQREAARFAPSLRVLVHHGPDRATADRFAERAAAHDLVVTTYTLLARDRAVIAATDFERVVLDEAQHVKNAATAQARAARAIPARHRLALTGTPVENRLDELRAILDFCNPGMLGSPKVFRSQFAIPIERDHDRGAVTRLHAVTRPFVLRRLKTDPTVIADLPAKQEMTVRANLTVEQAALYRAVVTDMMDKIKDARGMSRKGAVLAALTRLKQVCNHPAHFLADGSAVLRRGQHRSGKLALVEDLLDGVLADGDRALLFTQFRQFGELVAPWIAERFGLDEVPFLHGAVARGDRDRMIERFQTGGGPPIMLVSLKAGGTGVTLTAANHVVHLDRWWNPAVESQATDRAFRIGQRRDVQVRKLLCVGTVEERIDAMLGGKQELADLTVGSGETWLTELGADELAELMALGEDAVGE